MKKWLVALIAAVALFSFTAAAQAGSSQRQQVLKAVGGSSKVKVASVSRKPSPTKPSQVSCGSDGGTSTAGPTEEPSEPEQVGPYFCFYGGYVVNARPQLTYGNAARNGGEYMVYIGYWKQDPYRWWDSDASIGVFRSIFFAYGQQGEELSRIYHDSRKPYIYGYALSYVPCEDREYWHGGTITSVNPNPNLIHQDDDIDSYGKE